MCKDCGCGHSHDDKAFITVEGMTCSHCKESVEAALLKLPGVLSAVVDLDEKKATVSFSADKTNTHAMCEVIRSIGFEVDPNVVVEKGHTGIMGTITKFFK